MANVLTTITIGRGRDADVRVPSDERTVSRLHAELVVTRDGRCFLTDCGSENGTFVQERGSWRRIAQDYVPAESSLRFGRFQTSAKRILEAFGRRGAAKAGEEPPVVAGEAGPPEFSAPDSRADLPRGSVERDPETGAIIRRRP